MGHSYRTAARDWHERLQAGETIRGPDMSTLAVAGPEWLLGHLVDFIAAGPIHDNGPSLIWLRAVELYGRHLGMFHRTRAASEAPAPAQTAPTPAAPTPAAPTPTPTPDPPPLDPRILDMLRRMVAGAMAGAAPKEQPLDEDEDGLTAMPDDQPDGEVMNPTPTDATPSQPGAAPIPANDSAPRAAPVSPERPEPAASSFPGRSSPDGSIRSAGTSSTQAPAFRKPSPPSSEQVARRTRLLDLAAAVKRRHNLKLARGPPG